MSQIYGSWIRDSDEAQEGTDQKLLRTAMESGVFSLCKRWGAAPVGPSARLLLCACLRARRPRGCAGVSHHGEVCAMAPWRGGVRGGACKSALAGDGAGNAFTLVSM